MSLTPQQRFFTAEFATLKAKGLSGQDAALKAVEKYYPPVDQNLRTIEDPNQLKALNLERASTELQNTEVQDEIMSLTKGQDLNTSWIQKEHLKEYTSKEITPKMKLAHLTKL